jgi:hypothetical protein
LLPHRAAAAEAARERRGRLQVHIAASLNRDQSTIYRFEEAKAWPRNPDLVIQAYADDRDISAADIWADAVRRLAIATGREAVDDRGLPAPPDRSIRSTPDRSTRRRAS